jgi:hypothetical protein
VNRRTVPNGSQRFREPRTNGSPVPPYRGPGTVAFGYCNRSEGTGTARPDGHMREVESRQAETHVKGRPALERSLQALLVRVHRFARARAASAADRAWAARMIHGLQATPSRFGFTIARRGMRRRRRRIGLSPAGFAVVRKRLRQLLRAVAGRRSAIQRVVLHPRPTGQAQDVSRLVQTGTERAGGAAAAARGGAFPGLGRCCSISDAIYEGAAGRRPRSRDGRERSSVAGNLPEADSRRSPEAPVVRSSRFAAPLLEQAAAVVTAV